MIIHLKKSKLFTVEPAKRFAKEFNVPENIWIECWLKYKLLDLEVKELCDYIYIKTGRRLSHESVKRWIIRTEIYSQAKEAFKMGAETVVSSFFGEYEVHVQNELLRNLKSSARHIPRSIV